MFADDHGESHFADRESERKDAGPIGRLSGPVPSAAVVVRKNEPVYDYDWQVAPPRRFIVLPDGAIETELSDGSRRTIRGGDLPLMGDTGGGTPDEASGSRRAALGVDSARPSRKPGTNRREKRP